jgi:hypothetical protein
LNDQDALRALTTFFFFSRIVFEQLGIPEFLKENAWTECVRNMRVLIKPECMPLVDRAIEQAKNMEAFKKHQDITPINNPDVSDNEKSVAEQLAKIFQK